MRLTSKNTWNFNKMIGQEDLRSDHASGEKNQTVLLLPVKGRVELKVG
jgi:hypothetical protein